jgi:hypothetical protein
MAVKNRPVLIAEIDYRLHFCSNYRNSNLLAEPRRVLLISRRRYSPDCNAMQCPPEPSALHSHLLVQQLASL